VAPDPLQFPIPLEEHDVVLGRMAVGMALESLTAANLTYLSQG
jgi:hypothetical protein